MAVQPSFLNPRGPGPGPARASPSQPASAEAAATLVVGPGVHVKGQEIADCDTLMVDGTLEVSMQARMLRIAERGAFKGEVTVDVAEIRGRFEGTLTARQKLVVFSSGRVSGRVSYGSLVIEEGAELTGEVERKAAETASPAPARLPSAGMSPDRNEVRSRTDQGPQEAPHLPTKSQ